MINTRECSGCLLISLMKSGGTVAQWPFPSGQGFWVQTCHAECKCQLLGCALKDNPLLVLGVQNQHIIYFAAVLHIHPHTTCFNTSTLLTACIEFLCNAS